MEVCDLVTVELILYQLEMMLVTYACANKKILFFNLVFELRDTYKTYYKSFLRDHGES